MDQQRGRSPSVGRQQSLISHGSSPSAQHYQENISPTTIGLGLDAPLEQHYNYPSTLALPTYDNGFLNTQQGQQFVPLEGSYQQNQDFNQQFAQEDNQTNSPFGQQQPTSFTQELLNNNTFNEDFSLYSTPGGQGEQFDSNFFLNDPSQQPSGQSINPADIMSDMSSPPAHTPTPPHLLQPDTKQSSSAQHSPVFNHHQFQRSPGHSRNASLGPESAAYPQNQLSADWSTMLPQFTSHRRSPSEYSDVSASSAAPSPNMVQHDTFDSIEQHHSPLVRAQDSTGYQEVLGIGNFSISDPQIQHGASPHRGLSPAHSPAISPRLGPQQMPMINQQNPFGLSMGIPNNGFVSSSGHDMYGNDNQDSFGRLNHNGSVEMGQAPQIVPPEINVEFAPVTRQSSFDPARNSIDDNALTPPTRGKPFYCP